jgi:hypothetical protein
MKQPTERSSMSNATKQGWDGDFKHYFKKTKTLFPTYGKNEKEFFTTLQVDVIQYASEHPELSNSQIIEYFGEPNIIVSQYLAQSDAEQLIKQVKSVRWIKLCVIIVILIAVIVATIIVAMNYDFYNALHNSIVVEKETIIEYGN